MDFEDALRIASRGIMMVMSGFFLGSLAGAVIGAVLGASIGPFDYLLETAPDAEHLLFAAAVKWFMAVTPAGAFVGMFVGGLAGAASGAHLGGFAATGLGLLGTLQRWILQLSRRGSESARALLAELLTIFYGPLGGAVAGTWIGWLAGLFSRLLADPMGPSFTLAFLGPKGGALIGLPIGFLLGPAFLRKSKTTSTRTVPLLIGMVVGVSIAGSFGLILGAVAGWTFERWQTRLGTQWQQWPTGIITGLFCGFFVGGFDGIILGGLIGWAFENWGKKGSRVPVPVWQGSPPDEIYIARAGQVYGPYSRQAVQQQLADGALQSRDWAWARGASEWMGLYAIPLQETLPEPITPEDSPLAASDESSADTSVALTTAKKWRSSLFAAAGTGLDAGVVSGTLLGATAIFFLPSGLLGSMFLGAFGGGLVVAIGAVVVASILRATAETTNSTNFDILVGAMVGGFIGGFGEQIYLALGGELVAPFAGPFEHELFRALVGAAVGTGVGWLVGRRLRREQFLPALRLLES